MVLGSVARFFWGANRAHVLSLPLHQFHHSAFLVPCQNAYSVGSSINSGPGTSGTGVKLVDMDIDSSSPATISALCKSLAYCFRYRGRSTMKCLAVELPPSKDVRIIVPLTGSKCSDIRRIVSEQIVVGSVVNGSPRWGVRVHKRRKPSVHWPVHVGDVHATEETIVGRLCKDTAAHVDCRCKLHVAEQ